MTGWLIYAAAFAAFLGAHVIPIMARRPLTAWLGPRGYLTAFIVLSVVLLGLLIAAANAAPRVMLWPVGEWQRWTVNLVMPVVVALAVFGTRVPNPFGTLGLTQGFDPQRPGIAGVTRHPLMWAFGLWAGAHLLANGELAHVILFGAMAAFAAAGVAAGERRAKKTLPDFDRLAAHTSLWPGAALMQGRWLPRGWPDPWRTVLTIAIWAALWNLHLPVIGVSPQP